MHVGVSGNGFVAFRDFAIWGDKVFYPFGDRRPGHGPHRGRRTGACASRRTRRSSSRAIVDFPLDDGEVKQLHYERIGNQTAYLRCGMYGGTPVGGIHQGGYAGDAELVEGDVYDVNRPEVRAALVGLDEHLCRVTCDGETTTGLYQPIDPEAYRACAARTAPTGASSEASRASRIRRRERSSPDGDGVRAAQRLGRVPTAGRAPAAGGGPARGLAEGSTAFLEAELGPGAEPRVSDVAPVASIGNAREPWSFTVRWRTPDGAERVERCVMLIKAEAGQLDTALGPEFHTIAALAGSRRPGPPGAVARRRGPLAGPTVLRHRVRRPAPPRCDRCGCPAACPRSAPSASTSPGPRPACTRSTGGRRPRRAPRTGRRRATWRCGAGDLGAPVRAPTARAPPRPGLRLRLAAAAGAGGRADRRRARRPALRQPALRGRPAHRPARLGDGPPRRPRRGPRLGLPADLDARAVAALRGVPGRLRGGGGATRSSRSTCAGTRRSRR